MYLCNAKTTQESPSVPLEGDQHPSPQNVISNRTVNITTWLDTEHIAQSTPECEWHPLRPFLPEGAKVLFLGSFPPQRKRWCVDFYYPNYINDHWRIEGQVFYGDKMHFVDEAHKCFRVAEIIAHCQQKGIGFFDTSTAVKRLRDNASDKFLEVVVPTDIPSLISPLHQLRAIVVTGEKAAQTIVEALGGKQIPAVNSALTLPNLINAEGRPIDLYRLPSSSRAYPLAFDKKSEAYRLMFQQYL